MAWSLSQRQKKKKMHSCTTEKYTQSTFWATVHTQIPAYFTSVTPFVVKPTNRDTAQVRVAVQPTRASSHVFSP